MKLQAKPQPEFSGGGFDNQRARSNNDHGEDSPGWIFLILDLVFRYLYSCIIQCVAFSNQMECIRFGLH